MNRSVTLSAKGVLVALVGALALARRLPARQQREQRAGRTPDRDLGRRPSADAGHDRDRPHGRRARRADVLAVGGSGAAGPEHRARRRQRDDEARPGRARPARRPHLGRADHRACDARGLRLPLLRPAHPARLSRRAARPGAGARPRHRRSGGHGRRAGRRQRRTGRRHRAADRRHRQPARPVTRRRGAGGDGQGAGVRRRRRPDARPRAVAARGAHDAPWRRRRCTSREPPWTRPRARCRSGPARTSSP